MNELISIEEYKKLCDQYERQLELNNNILCLFGQYIENIENKLNTASELIERSLKDENYL